MPPSLTGISSPAFVNKLQKKNTLCVLCLDLVGYVALLYRKVHILCMSLTHIVIHRAVMLLAVGHWLVGWPRRLLLLNTTKNFRLSISLRNVSHNDNAKVTIG